MDENNNDVRLVGRKSNMPLLLVVGLIALGLLGFMWWKSMDTQSVATNVSTTTAQRSVAIVNEEETADNIENIADMYAVTDPTELHNQNVEFNDVSVTSVVSERVFLVNQGGTNQSLLVKLDEDLTENEDTPIITVGQRLDLKGELRNVAEENIEEGEYTRAEIAAAINQRVFLNATQIDVK